MKTNTYILCLALSLFTLTIKAQVTLEHTYNTASDLYISKLANSGYKYVNVNVSTNQLNLYNLNHSLYKAITIPAAPSGSGPFYHIKYVSETTFDTDNQLEYAAIYKDGNYNDYYIRIYKENGTLMFSADTFQIYNIMNTDSGTKMITTKVAAGLTTIFKVYGLPGTLLTAMIKHNDNNSNMNELSVYPNPTKDYSRIEYTLPQGVTYGEIVFYTLNGSEVKRYRVDNTFNDLLIDNTELSSGTYLYQLITNNNISATKKMVVIK